MFKYVSAAQTTDGQRIRRPSEKLKFSFPFLPVYRSLLFWLWLLQLWPLQSRSCWRLPRRPIRTASASIGHQLPRPSIRHRPCCPTTTPHTRLRWLIRLHIRRTPICRTTDGSSKDTKEKAFRRGLPHEVWRIRTCDGHSQIKLNVNKTFGRWNCFSLSWKKRRRQIIPNSMTRTTVWNPLCELKPSEIVEVTYWVTSSLNHTKKSIQALSQIKKMIL